MTFIRTVNRKHYIYVYKCVKYVIYISLVNDTWSIVDQYLLWHLLTLYVWKIWVYISSCNYLITYPLQTHRSSVTHQSFLNIHLNHFLFLPDGYLSNTLPYKQSWPYRSCLREEFRPNWTLQTHYLFSGIRSEPQNPPFTVL